MKPYPLFFRPDLKEKVWGGSKIESLFNKSASGVDSTRVGESWEIAAHPNGSSIIMNGELNGMTFEDAIRHYKRELMGHDMMDAEKFPLLLKIIDAKDDLSVQVHPEDEFAMLFENGELGKNESWYVLEADPDAELVMGLKPGTTKEKFIEALDNEHLETVLNIVPVKAHDVFDIPAGLVHAIGSGIVLAEIQQNSDTTYRVYDWNRKDENGIGRELHIDKAIQVIDFEDRIPITQVNGHVENFGNCSRTVFVDNDYFTLESFNIGSEYIVSNRKDEFELFLCVKGSGSLHWTSDSHYIGKGTSFYIPPSVKNFEIKGPLSLLRMRNKRKYGEVQKVHNLTLNI
jgi:mannose-6-phosphate isomerase